MAAESSGTEGACKARLKRIRAISGGPPKRRRTRNTQRDAAAVYHLVVHLTRSIAAGLGSIVAVLVIVALAFRYGLLPPEVYGALVGALLTLLGVHIKSRYDADVKRIELLYGLRRDVYLEAAEGLARSRDNLLWLSRPQSIQTGEADIPAAPETWLQKLELVAAPQTVVLAREAARLHAATVFDLMKRRARVQKIDFDLKYMREHRDRLYQIQRETMDEFTEAVAETDPDLRAARFRIVEDHRVRAQQALDENRRNDDLKQAERDVEYRELARAAIRGSVTYLREVNALQNAIRREITLEPGTAQDIPPGEPDLTEEQLDDFAEYLNALWQRDDAG